MKTRAEYINIIKSHANELKSRYGVTSLRIFGSVARDEHREDSDLDIMVKMPPQAYLMADTMLYLENALGCKVDLVRDRSNLRPSFRKLVENDAITII